MVVNSKEIPFSEYQALMQAQAEKLIELSLTPEEKILREFNQKYAIVRTATTHILFQRSETAFELDSRSSFKNFHENDFFINSEGKVKNKAVFWLKHPQRRTFENIVFDPTRPGDYENNFNIFKGFAIVPKKGDCNLYWKHVKEVICSSHESSYDYVRKWMACVVQRPTLLATAIVLRGLQGTGKNKFVEYFGRLFGPYYLTLTSLEHLTGKFNSHLKYAYLVHANEALWGGSKKEVGALKAFITDPTIIIEGKGKDALPIDNCRHLIISSNEDWAVPIDLDDRRFFVLNISPHRKEDSAYFRALSEQMDQQGLSALLFDLLHEDISIFDPRKMPPNDFAFDIKMKTAGSVEKFLFAALYEGRFKIASSREDQWKPLSCEELYDHYKAWCLREGLRQEVSSEFGKRLKKLLSIEKSRRSVSDSREWWYEIPSLKECRKRFQAYTKQTELIWEH
ncbi:MAG: hypothetical protein K2P51_03615 [Rhabdochlamydiaceae bacterium]|nr:hypothetical protein [Rhabdochlamydiaceae bacterium]